mgnify:CR=1 FL=1
MSGTSLDGIDLVCINLKYADTWSFSIEASQTIPYTTNWKTKLENLRNGTDYEIQKENKLYTIYLADKINNFIHNHNLKNLDAVCSHGHTLFHQPDKGLTFQLGNLKELAEIVRYTVVCDYRSQDVAKGGQGAPLVPIGDKLLFSEYSSFLNLGGFANATQNLDETTIAYDICAVNVILNVLAKKKGLDYDNKGNLAKMGKIIIPFFNELEGLDYYKNNPPKSLGIEWVKLNIIPLLDKYKNHLLEDLIHTYTNHIAKQIGFLFKRKELVLVTGGGAHNEYLIKKIKKNSSAQIILPHKEIINFKEAIIFGFLGILKLRGEINCLSSVTGAYEDHSSGTVYLP